MTDLDLINRKRIDLRRLVVEMRGLSPKTSTYKKYAAQAEALQIELSKLGATRGKKK